MAATVSIILAIAAFIACVVSAMGKAPLWVSVVLLCVIAMLQALPR